MVVGSTKEAQTVLFLVILRVLVECLQFHFRVNVSCKLALGRGQVKLPLTNL